MESSRAQIATRVAPAPDHLAVLELTRLFREVEELKREIAKQRAHLARAIDLGGIAVIRARYTDDGTGVILEAKRKGTDAPFVPLTLDPLL